MRWSVDQRLAFIETRLYWEGRINRKDLEEYFHISTPQASGDFKRYMAECPDNMIYDFNKKVYKISPDFHPKYISTDPEEFFFQLKLTQNKRFKKQIYLGYLPEIYLAPYPARFISPQTLRKVLQAMRDKHALEIQYQSMTTPEPHWRWITPHAFGFDGSRWHLRCYCHSHKEFRDFLLARILNTGETRQHRINPQKDLLWHTQIDFHIRPHPELSQHQQRVIELDFGMKNSQTTFPVKAAFVFYILRSFEYEWKGASDTQPRIILTNKKEIIQQVEQLKSQQKEIDPF